MLKPFIQAVPTHIITGFLGAGKTTLLNQLLSQRPAHETWAVLINEFGKIGVDQALIAQHDGIAIREVVGGCLCCTSQLPMQVALARLLQQTQPDRLFIEPTGLAHADQLVEQLSQSHWQTSLKLQAVVCVVSAAMLLDQRYRQHDTLISQLEVSDILVISHANSLTESHQRAIEQLISHYPKFSNHVYLTEQGQLDFAHINQLPSHRIMTRRALLTHTGLNRTGVDQQTDADTPQTPLEPPFHYVEQALQHEVAGWCLPADWQFEQQALIDCLLSTPDWQRIKAVMQTEQGWLAINFTPTQLNYHSHAGFGDNRLEIIINAPAHPNSTDAPSYDWTAFEQKLLATLRTGSQHTASSYKTSSRKTSNRKTI